MPFAWCEGAALKLRQQGSRRAARCLLMRLEILGGLLELLLAGTVV